MNEFRILDDGVDAFDHAEKVVHGIHHLLRILVLSPGLSQDALAFFPVVDALLKSLLVFTMTFDESV